MELTQTLPNTGGIMQRLALGHALGIALVILATLLFISCYGFFMGLRTGLVPPLDLHLTLDGRHALVIHNDLPCVPDEPPQGECGEAGWHREFKVMYSSLDEDWVLIAFELPEP
jgi:hypothetical protein